jgi:hypothetical protein
MFIGDSEYAFMRAALHIQCWRPNGWTDRDPNWNKHSLGQSAQVMGVGKRGAGERARSARVNQWNMAAKRECAARVSRVAWSKKKRNLIQKVRGSMRRAHIKAGMLKNGHFIDKC